MPIKYVGFNPELILRRFYNSLVNFSENAIFKKCSKIAFKEKSKELNIVFLI